MKPQIRRIVIQVEETHQEIGRTIDPPARKVTVAAVINNPYAGKYVDDGTALRFRRGNRWTAG